MYTHKCIKCQEVYQDTDPEPYYCAVCNEERKKIAAEVDRKIGSRPAKQTTSALQEYDSAPKMGQFMIVSS